MIEPRGRFASLHAEDQLRVAVFLLVCLLVYGFNLGVRRLFDDLVRSQRNLADFLDNTAIGILWVGPDGSVLWANQAEVAMLGCEPGDLVGHHVAEFHAEQSTIDDILKRLRRGESLHDCPSQLRARDGRVLDVLIDANVLWQDGEYVHARFLVRDVTERNAFEAALRESEAQLQQQAAEALHLYESEGVARAQAELAVRRTSALQAAAAALVEARSERDVAGAVLGEAMAVLEASSGCFCLPDEAREVVLNLAVAGDIRDDNQGEISLTADPRLASVMRDRRAVLVSSPAEQEALFPDAPPVDGAWAAIPVLDGDQLVAVLQVAWPAPRELPPDDIDLLFAFARLAAQALERARLYQAEQDERRRAELARERIAGLQGVTAALGETMTQGQVAEAVVREGVSALGASSGVIVLFDRTAAELYVAARRGFPQRPSRERFALANKSPLALAVTSGHAVLITNPASADAYEFEVPRLDGEASWAAVPIFHNDEVFGALRFAWLEEQVFPPEEVELMETLARQTGQALERARLYQSEQHLRRSAEHSAFQTGRLHAARSALSAALTPAEVAEVILKEGLSALQGSAGAVSLVLPEGDELEVVAASGYPAEVPMTGQRFSIDAANPVTEAFRTGQPVFYESARAIVNRYPQIQEVKTDLKTEGVACVPLLITGTCFGVLSVSFLHGRVLTNAERDLIQAFANQAAQALERARLYEAETEARRQAEQAADRLAQLQAVTAALSEAATISQIDQVFVSSGLAAAGAGAGSIYTLSEDGQELHAMVRSGYEYSGEISRSLPLSRFPDLEHIIETSQPSFLCTPEDLPDEARSMAALSGTQSQSWALVPTQHGRRATGVIVFSFVESQPFEDAHRELLVTLGRQFGEALERARLYEAEKDLRTRMNAVLADIPGVVWEAWGPPDPASQRIDFVSDYAESMLGYPSDDWLSTSAFWLHIIHPEDMEAARIEALEAFERGGHALLQFRWVKKDGSVIDAMTYCSVIADHEGRPIGMRGISFDMTEQKQAELALRESELRAKSVLETAANGIITIDEGGVVESMNPAAERIFGYSADEVIGRDVSMLMPSPDRGRHGSYIRNYLETGVPKIIGIGRDVLGRRKDGTTFDMELSVSEVRPAGRRVFTGIVNDISGRKRAMRAMQFLASASDILSSSLDYDTALKSLARVTVPAIADWCAIDIWESGRLQRVAVVHSDGDKVELAKALQMRSGDSNTLAQVRRVLQELQPRLFREITPEQFDRIGDDDRRELLRSLGLRSAIIAPLLGSAGVLGAITLVNAESEHLFDEEDLALAAELGRRAGIAVENARLYRESERTQAELRLANEAKDEFLGLVSHELRTPITSIYGGARFLRLRAANVDDRTREDLIANMEQESEKLHRLVENLLALARSDLGREVSLEPLLLGQLVARAVQSFAKSQPGRLIEVEDKAAGAVALGEPTYVEQVLQNLISNADKYSPAGEPITVLVEGGEHDKEVVVRVLDRGPGISPEEINLIFESFYRSSKTARHAPGKGLGLTVCKRLVEAMHGRVWARSRNRGGLEVGFALAAGDQASEPAPGSTNGASTSVTEAGTPSL